MTNPLSSGWFEKDWHPSQDDLLTYVDGGLAPRKAANVGTHLEQCWGCRVKAEKIQRTISLFVDYFDRVMTPNMVPPPQGWRTFPGQLGRVIDECKRPGLLSRCSGLFMESLF